MPRRSLAFSLHFMSLLLLSCLLGLTLAAPRISHTIVAPHTVSALHRIQYELQPPQPLTEKDRIDQLQLQRQQQQQRQHKSAVQLSAPSLTSASVRLGVDSATSIGAIVDSPSENTLRVTVLPPGEFNTSLPVWNMTWPVHMCVTLTSKQSHCVTDSIDVPKRNETQCTTDPSGNVTFAQFCQSDGTQFELQSFLRNPFGVESYASARVPYTIAWRTSWQPMPPDAPILPPAGVNGHVVISLLVILALLGGIAWFSFNFYKRRRAEQARSEEESYAALLS